MRTNKLIALLMALMLCLSLAVAASAESDTSEHVVLTMYCIGDEGGIHAQEHLDLINKALTEKINAEIQPVMVSWGDYRQKLPMVWASGEAYDLTYAASWTGYYTEGSKGAFMDITELAPKYAPKTYAMMEARGIVDNLKINGKLYMMPNDKPDYTTFVYCYREDLRVKYGCPEIVDDATLEVYLKALKDNEPGMLAFGDAGNSAMPYQQFLNEMDWSRPVDNSNGFLAYDLKDPSRVFNVTETPEYAAYVAKMRGYYENGYISKSIMAITDQPRDLFKAGKTGTYFGNFSNTNDVYLDFTVNHPDWQLGIYSADLASGNVETIAPANNGMCVGAYSKNPERALMFIELMYTDEEFYSLMMNGIEGVTFEWDPETRTKWAMKDVDPAELALKNLGMGFGYYVFDLGSLNDSPVVNQLKDTYAACALVPALSGFTVNQDEISVELAAMKAVQDEFKIPLDKGVVDPEAGIADLQERLKNAGIDKVIEAINAQIAAFQGK